MSFPWFRMYAEFLADPVVQSLAFEDQRHYVAVLCLKCNGTLDKELPRDALNRIIARGLGLDLAAADEARRRIAEVGIIDPETWQPKGWESRQFLSDSGNAVGNTFGNTVTYAAQKQKRYRERKHLNHNGSGNALRNDVVTVTPSEQIQNRTEQKKLTKKVEKKSTTAPSDFPITKSMTAYANSKGVAVGLDDITEHFLIYHRAKGSRFVDWSAAWQNWVRRHVEFAGGEAAQDWSGNL